ncbi:MAG: Rieske 2Fe-2S domain-containing protein [Ilumatobacteraceae bacterium]
MRATSIGHAGILIETAQGSIVCDPWFEPAFFGSWFPFPRNDRLPARVNDAIRRPSFLYISHLHGDHLDEQWLLENMPRLTPVLLPDYPTQELERRLRGLGFTEFVRTINGEEIDLGDGLKVAIHVETAIADGPGGDSALVITDGVHRLVNQNDCRTSDLTALASHGPVDLHWLQFSGAIWYPMVYEMPDDEKRRLVQDKVESQFARALRYVEAINARHVVPSAGPPAFLDPELFDFNVITGDELSIFPDQTEFLRRLSELGRSGMLNVPGTTFELIDHSMTAVHPFPDHEVEAIFSDKESYLRKYQADNLDRLDQMKNDWARPSTDLIDTLRAWWEPLMVMAPTLRSAIGGRCLLRAGDLDILLDFPNGRVLPDDGGDHDFRFEIDRRLVETVVANGSVDWSDKLFLSCRFHAWRRGEYNEFLYNFFKSLSVERMQRAEAEAVRRLRPEAPSEEIVIGDYLVERYCPHRRADLSVFGECDGDVLVCTLHGWKFDLETGRCLTAADRALKVRRFDSEPSSDS